MWLKILHLSRISRSFNFGQPCIDFPITYRYYRCTDKRVFEEIHRIIQRDYQVNPDAEKRLYHYPPVSPSLSPSLTLMDIQPYVFTQPCTLALVFPCWGVSSVLVCWKAFTGAASLVILSQQQVVSLLIRLKWCISSLAFETSFTVKQYLKNKVKHLCSVAPK